MHEVIDGDFRTEDTQLQDSIVDIFEDLLALAKEGKIKFAMVMTNDTEEQAAFCSRYAGRFNYHATLGYLSRMERIIHQMIDEQNEAYYD